MHIEKNVFDNIIGIILGLQGKTKYDIKAREGLEQQGIRKELWWNKEGSTSRKEKVTKAPYTVLPNERADIFEFIKDAKYPYGYAGSLKNKINVDDKKFNGLKTHDYHVMLQRLLPMVFPPAFFTIMVHLLIHLPEQVLLKGPVHYSWMYPIERFLCEYKRSIRNSRYPEGCIAEKYITHECITYCKLYINDATDMDSPNEA
ncbi:unnamed protein product [Rhodiola kirilowii]